MKKESENSSKKTKYSFNTYGFRKIFSLQSFSGKICEILRKVCKIQRNFFSAKLFVGYKPIVEMGLFVNERNISKQTKYYGVRWCCLKEFKVIDHSHFMDQSDHLLTISK